MFVRVPGVSLLHHQLVKHHKMKLAQQRQLSDFSLSITFCCLKPILVVEVYFPSWLRSQVGDQLPHT